MSSPEMPKQQPQTWEQAMLEKLLMQVYREKRKDRNAKWIRLFIWLAFFALIFAIMHSNPSGGGGNANALMLAKKDSHTAVINLSGVIDSYNDNAAKLLEGLEAADIMGSKLLDFFSNNRSRRAGD